MTNINDLEFKGKWRSYQQRILNELTYHLTDDKLNIVAAPGAGKTTLGIEVLLRLKHPALILAPTITIKNQWKERIIDNFLNKEPENGFISDNLENIGVITISTYQNIHSIYKEKGRKEKLYKDLKEHGVKTLILDEAHHLRTEWYATLYNLCENLRSDTFKVVSLTGTPPYDVAPSEWENYNSLCGPVDAEISIPELVKAGDLCPHQDLIYFSDLTDNENKEIEDFLQRKKEFFKYVKDSNDVLYSVESSPFVENIEENTELIYENTNFTISLISYLLSTDNLHIGARILAEFLELDINIIPKFDDETAETFFEGITGQFKEYFKNSLLIKNKLKEYNLIKNRTVDFTGKLNFKNMYSRSLNKLNSLKEITQFEYANISNNLREVILADYIGKGESDGLNILSVFDKLYSLKINLSILTGNLIVIPEGAKEEFYQIIKERNTDTKKVLTTQFKPGYIRVEAYTSIDIVSIVTELFEKGYMNVIIGTAALLGEGWDSPCVNTLIIASTVGSFMLSNQMRGRALRIDKKNPDKSSNIWHLAALGKQSEEFFDLLTVQKRFRTFEGISYNNTNRIQNGIERLGFDLNECDFEKLNIKSLNYAKKRNDLKQDWEQVFKKSKITESNMAPLIYEVIEGSTKQTSIITCSIPSWCSFAQTMIEASSIYDNTKKKNIFNKIILKLADKFHWIDKDYKNIVQTNYQIYVEQTMLENFAKCLLITLCNLSIIKTDYEKLILRADKKAGHDFYITLLGCSNYERNIFIKAFEELFKINDNYRYILKQNDKYLGIPYIIGTKSKNVKMFVKYLEKELGIFDIIFTKNPQGYKELLKAKYNVWNTSGIKNSRVWL